MIKYYIKAKSGDFLAQDQEGYYETANMMLALSYDTAAKAKKIIKNSIKRVDRSNYRIVQVVHVGDIAKTQEPETTVSICDSFERVVDQYNAFVGDCESRMVDLYEQLSKIDREVCDIEHYIEFSSLSASSGYKAYRKLHDKLMERRVIKNEIETIQKIKCANTGVFDTVRKFLTEKKEKTYKPRELPELFS